MTFARTALLVLTSSLAACGVSTASDDVTAGRAGGGGAGGGGGSGGAGAGGGLGDASIDVGLSDGPLDGACASVGEQATFKPVDLFVLFDQSSSMALQNKWANAQSGLDAFLQDPASAGLSVALTFFPGLANTGCDSKPYQSPVVPLGVLPGNASAMLSAFPATPPGLSTPMYPALAGALSGALAHAQATPTHTTALLFITDGKPDGPATCTGVVPPKKPSDADVIAALVQNGTAQSPPILTFVVGLPGADFATLDTIASGGGTGQSVKLVDPATVQADFQKALAQVRGSTIACEFPLPTEVSGGTVDPGLVNVTYTPGGSTTPKTLAKATDCANGGWQYDVDPPGKPTKIVLCPTTCQQVRGDYLGPSVTVELGCSTIVN